MYIVNVKVEGVATLLQHRFPMPELGEVGKGSKKRTGAVNYNDEWKDYLYVGRDGSVFQPSTHFERAMVKAAKGFKITGQKGKTYSDLFQAAILVTPDEIPHGIQKPEKLDGDADKPLYLDMRPVVVSRARVVRIRPAFKPGWSLEFDIICNDDQISSEVVYDVLQFAGKAVGIGDHRPKFGRFIVTKFDVN